MAKNIDKPRLNLNQSNLEMLIFLKYNLRALAYEDVEDTLIPLNWTPQTHHLLIKHRGSLLSRSPHHNKKQRMAAVMRIVTVTKKTRVSLEFTIVN